MAQRKEWESPEEILAKIQQAGATERQFRRWRNEGLVPKPDRVGLGRGRGFELRYPIGTADQALAVLRWKGYDRRAEVVKWCLWSEGYPAAFPVRERLLQAFTWYRDQLRELMAGVESGDPSNPILRAKTSPLAIPGLGFLRGAMGVQPSLAFIRLLLDLVSGSSGVDVLSQADITLSTEALEVMQRRALGRRASEVVDEFAEPATPGTVSETLGGWRTLFDLDALCSWLSDERTESQIDDIRRQALGWYWIWAPDQAKEKPLPFPLFLFTILFYRIGWDYGLLVNFMLERPEAREVGEKLRDFLLKDWNKARA